MFGPHKFVHAPGSTVRNATTKGPADLLAHFHDDLHVKFAGIRKPRTYSHHDLSNASGWLLPDSFEVGAGPNNVRAARASGARAHGRAGPRARNALTSPPSAPLPTRSVEHDPREWLGGLVGAADGSFSHRRHGFLVER